MEYPEFKREMIKRFAAYHKLTVKAATKAFIGYDLMIYDIWLLGWNLDASFTGVIERIIL